MNYRLSVFPTLHVGYCTYRVTYDDLIIPFAFGEIEDFSFPSISDLSVVLFLGRGTIVHVIR